MQPVNNKLYFAGEHLYHQHIGTAYGAHCTGQFAAQTILSGKIIK
jgi:hypothetical protein